MLSVEVVAIDAREPHALAHFWATALGWSITEDDGDEVLLRAPDGEDGDVRALLFLRVPDEKRQKNRLHLDLRPDDQDVEVARLEALGATRADVGQKDVTWVVLADPEDNEFCVLRSRSA